MRKLIVLATPLTLSFAAPLFGAYPDLAPNQPILSALKDTSNFSISTTQYGFSLANGALDPTLYINSIDLVPGVGYDANIGLSTPGVFSTNVGPYTLGDPIAPGAGMFLYDAVSRFGNVDPSVSNGIYDFNIQVKGGYDTSATDVLGDLAYQIRIANGVQVTITGITATPNTISAGQTTVVGVTLTNNDPTETWVNTTWFVGAFSQGANTLNFDSFFPTAGWNWFNKSVAPGDSLTGDHSSYSADALTPLGAYSPNVGLVGGLYNGDSFWLNAPGDPLVTVTVPEPTSLGFAAVSACLLLHRRRA